MQLITASVLMKQTVFKSQVNATATFLIGGNYLLKWMAILINLIYKSKHYITPNLEINS